MDRIDQRAAIMTNTRPHCYQIPSYALALLLYRRAQEKKLAALRALGAIK